MSSSEGSQVPFPSFVGTLAERIRIPQLGVSGVSAEICSHFVRSPEEPARIGVELIENAARKGAGSSSARRLASMMYIDEAHRQGQEAT